MPAQIKTKMAYKWKPSASQRRAFAEKMQDPDEQAAYQARKQNKADKLRAGSSFDYGSAGGNYVPTQAQYAFCLENMHLAQIQDDKVRNGDADPYPNNIRCVDVFNQVMYGFTCQEKVHHDYIHIVNELRRDQ
jgi:hypothetical protein